MSKSEVLLQRTIFLQEKEYPELISAYRQTGRESRTG
jgi:hypothetical protein